MTLREHLTALSEKATGGEWTFCRNPENTRWIIDNEPNRAILCTAGHEPNNQANAALITALVNAWRDGQLVTREEHERVRGLLDNLQMREAAYRSAHDLHGDGSMKSGSAWDAMRHAGDKARAALNGSN